MSSLPDAALVRARRAVRLQLSAYLAAAAIAVLGSAARSGTELADWIGFGLISPLVIAALLSFFGRPRRRVQGEPSERPGDARVATPAQETRLARAVFAVLVGVAVVLAVFGRQSVLVIAAVGLAHAIALTLLDLRLARLERRLGAVLYQRLSAGIWRERLYPLREPGEGDPELLAALGRRAEPPSIA